jgi:hypothetical protein
MQDAEVSSHALCGEEQALQPVDHTEAKRSKPKLLARGSLSF